MALKFNEAQELAVNLPVVMLLCGPGGGKTATSLRRINRLIESGAAPSEIIMMTFSREAARDMEARYAMLYHKNPGIVFCTIHSFCLGLLREYKSLDVGCIMTQTEQEQFFMQQLGQVKVADKKGFVKNLLLDIGRMKNTVTPLDEYEPVCTDRKLFTELYRKYEDYKTVSDKIDFDDMIMQAYEELLYYREVRAAVRRRYRHFIFDEGQDATGIQFKILRLIAGEENRSVLIVADDDQSIYSFRGADPKILLNIKELFPEIEIITNEWNYRSGYAIVDHACSLIRHNKVRFDKEFHASSAAAGSVTYRLIEDREKELDEVASEIGEKLKEGMSAKEIAVLYRTNKQSVLLMDKFIKAGIPFRVADTVESKYEMFMWEDILSFQRLSEGCGTKYDLIKTLNRPNRYIYGKGLYDHGFDESYILGVLSAQKKKTWQAEKSLKEAKEYFELIRSLKDLPPAEFMERLLVSYEEFIKEYADFTKEAPSENTEIYRSYIEDAKKHGTWKELRAYASRYNLLLRSKSHDRDGVTVSTFHRSKGLEWMVVYLIDAVSGKCPLNRSLATEAGLEEERRLFYVGMTRAKSELHVRAYCEADKELFFPSEFIEEAGIEEDR